ncbi:hypothetical protein PT105_00110 [Erysipelothrix rhusiopathiae]|uniref:hypothetical protein n=1 Tax=Erysipelothrix rhusiopathiae TaxID=1648 RepID=UPI000F4328AA|nr:hypothetical protein [Erysipelothrix rhusiopathiae]AYV34455.1 hypothetical protein EEY85_03815 [Erysipelothrix rhusiopathiae]MDE8081058.1 hypothetical protein [Erysipelothrix rhusiopathiae]MDE8314522.1 hypothetical protein [Erysipelothrix rhusiopathiae]MDE8329270.1 hypothetical protein [Erysipelothrix rhusiopathiae]MDE8333091.1 hypothetical protein [Erysipelothrix rhusiopathiae]
MRKRNILPTLFILIGLGCLGGAYILNQEGYRLYAALACGTSLFFVIMSIIVISIHKGQDYENLTEEDTKEDLDDEVVDQFQENLESDDIKLVEPEIEMEDIEPFEVTNSTRIFNPTNFDDPLKTAQSPSKNIDMKQNESEQQTTDASSRVTLTLVRSDENQENIYQLLHKMNARGLLKESVAYKMNFEQIQNHKLCNKYIFENIFNDIPSISLVKERNRKETLTHIKVMAGVSDNDLVLIGYIPTKHLVEVHKSFDSIYHIRGKITGGHYKNWKSDGACKQGELPFIASITIFSK